MGRVVHASKRTSGRAAPTERLAAAVATLPEAARTALADVADRQDLPLVAGSWKGTGGGCLVANVLAHADVGDAGTLDVRMLNHFPELSSRDLNRLIVAWDEAAADAGAHDDAALRLLLRDALFFAEGAERAAR